MRDRIQIASFRRVDQVDTVQLEEVEIDYMALADILLGLEPTLRCTGCAFRRSETQGESPPREHRSGTSAN